jgi:outer membrane protein OmpA-like peptidoglycan-associated protein
MNIGKAPAVLCAVLTAALISGGCATKKHVREAIAPVQQQVNDVQKQGNDNKAAIGDLDRQVATADEKAVDAGKRAQQAADAASAAQNSANQAAQHADSANSAAMQAQQNVARVDGKFQNLDNYHLADTKQVYFKTGQYILDKDAKEALDNAVNSLGNMRNYVIEIEGFADHTGPKAYNLELSRKRADAVVRYLTVDHNIPLRNVRTLGIGSEFPNAVNKTRDDRKNNRRVDLKIYALDINGTQSAVNGTATDGANTADRARPQQ